MTIHGIRYILLLDGDRKVLLRRAVQTSTSDQPKLPQRKHMALPLIASAVLQLDVNHLELASALGVERFILVGLVSSRVAGDKAVDELHGFSRNDGNGARRGEARNISMNSINPASLLN